ncbi:hypothetical protein JCM11641_008303 [Rhodosporidiobolus odoratus]
MGKTPKTSSITVTWKVDRLEEELGSTYDDEKLQNFRRELLTVDGEVLETITSGGNRLMMNQDFDGCGTAEVVSWEELYWENETVKRDNAFIIRLTITTPSDLPSPPDEEPDEEEESPETSFSESLCEAFMSFFEDPAASDVRSVLPATGTLQRSRELVANKRFLMARSSYFKSMFSSGFAEGAAADVESDDARPAKRVKREPSQADPSVWVDDDDSLDWLPEDWLEKYGPEDNGERAAADEAEEGNGQENDGKAAVKITDTGYITYRAMLYYLYTERIEFTALASDFTVKLLKQDSSDKTADSDSTMTSAEETEPDVKSRRAYLLAQTEKNDYPVEPASAHAIYRASPTNSTSMI